MVSVNATQIDKKSIYDDPSSWIARLPSDYSDTKKKVLKRALILTQEKVKSSVASEATLAQALMMVDILVQLKVDPTAVLAAGLYPFYQHHVFSSDLIEKEFGRKVVELCEGIERMDALQSLQARNENDRSEQSTDNFRKMLLAMVNDVRLVLIKLAERLTVLRQVKHQSLDVQKAVALEVNDIYAPLANRLGVGQLKWEMEDLSFRYSKPQEYKTIAKYLAEKRIHREDYVEKCLTTIKEELRKLGIQNAEVMGRAKHIYSIWRKMQRKNVAFGEIYDVRAVRVLVDEVPQCYAVLGAIHGLWKHIPKEFDDYIATPKENGYRSLHTAVVGPEGKTIEVQIRTRAMHQESELGVAAHWKYKEGGAQQQAGFEAKIAWLRQILEWQEEVADNSDLVEDFRSNVIEDRVYVFTPQGKVIDLPSGSTPIDFAYHVHTDVGHQCRGAKISGRIVPLTYALQTGQQVEILTSKNGQPSRDWLNPHNGYIKSSRARSKIHQWFRHQDRDKNAAAGRTIIEKELQRHAFSTIDLNVIASKFNLFSEHDLCAAVGAGDIGITQLLNAIRALQGLDKPQQKQTKSKSPSKQRLPQGDAIQIEGVGSLLTRVAGCCKPVPGDPIKGYITQGRGVVVHRDDCNYILKSQITAPERLIEVSWGDEVDSRYLVDIVVEAFDRKGLLKDITTVCANEKVSIDSLNTTTQAKTASVKMIIRLSIKNVEKLSKVLAQLSQVQNVMNVERAK